MTESTKCNLYEVIFLLPSVRDKYLLGQAKAPPRRGALEESINERLSGKVMAVLSFLQVSLIK